MKTLFAGTPHSYVPNSGAVHFIGVGGIGMSGLAEVLARAGFNVQGSDLGEPYTADKLNEAGVQVFKGHAADQLGQAQLVVISSAVKDDNVELVEAKKRGLRIIHRADMLAEIMTHYRTVAVSGTHGKTSTTALIFAALRAAGVPVGVINGGVLNDLMTNAVLPPKDGWLVVEADESDASFLKLKPTVAVVTNIEPEHMETYGSEEKLLAAFLQFIESAEEAVMCADDPNTLIVAARGGQGLEGPDTGPDVLTYGLTDDADVYTREYAPQGAQMAFDVVLRGATLEDVVVNLPGVHYVQNSLAALTVVQLLKGDVIKAAEGLATFAGVGRRFSRVGTFNGATVIDDYGHHPTEIAVTLDAAKGMFAQGRVVAVIQPHRFTRLRDLMDEFATSAKVADACLVLPVYAAGEQPLDGVTHTELVDRMRAAATSADHLEPAQAVADEQALVDALDAMQLGEQDAIICLGAGSISGMAKNLTKY